MENSGKIILGVDDPSFDDPEWYVAIGDGAIGPLSAREVLDKLQRGEVSLAHYVWKASYKDWKRICDVREFEIAVPAQPTKRIQAQVREEASNPSIRAPRQAPEEKRG